MKTQDNILDAIGILLIILSIVFFAMKMITFDEGTLVGITGLSLFLLKGSYIRKLLVKIIDKYLNK